MNKFLPYIEYLKEKKFWHSIEFSVSNKCIAKCNMCDHWKRKDHNISYLKYWWRIMFRLYHCGTKTIVLTGGEPLLSQINLNRLITEVNNVGLKVGVITSGLTNNENFNFTALSTISEWIRFSIDGEMDIHCKIRKITPEQYDKIINRLILCYANNENVRINFTIQKDNYKHIASFINFIRSRVNADIKICFWIERSFEKILTEKIKENIVDQIYSNNKFNDIVNIEGGNFNLFEKEPFTKCYASAYHLFIDEKGDMYPCCYYGENTELKSKYKEYIIGNIEKMIKNNVDFEKFYEKYIQSDLFQTIVHEREEICKHCYRFASLNNMIDNYEHKPLFL